MLSMETSPGGVRVIRQGAEDALAKRLQDREPGFASDGAVQQRITQILHHS
ncbi:hypothetical protein ACQ4M3_23145 [Leptolyngbya sp. AN03gr2]|uniref:hypothetical protein n=1 Tax=unclassified Leptolyngbya TaxID=2650499 RepID=UPI003D314267